MPVSSLRFTRLGGRPTPNKRSAELTPKPQHDAFNTILSQSRPVGTKAKLRRDLQSALFC